MFGTSQLGITTAASYTTPAVAFRVRLDFLLDRTGDLRRCTYVPADVLFSFASTSICLPRHDLEVVGDDPASR